MPIPFACDCGKKMTAKEEFAGRRLRCPDCQKVVTIPKAGSTVVAVAQKSKAPPAENPTLTRAELEALGIARSAHETPAPSRTVPVEAPIDFGNLFASPSPAPKSALAKPLSAPLAAPPAAPHAAPLAAPLATSAGKTPHPWVDTSLQQVATPWRPGDEDRFQEDVSPAREWVSPFGWLVPLVVIAAVVCLFAFPLG